MKKMTSEKKHKITTIGLWLILILCTAVLFSLCLSEGIDYDEAYSYRTAHDNTMMGIIRVVLAAHDTDVPVWYMGLRLWAFLHFRNRSEVCDQNGRTSFCTDTGLRDPLLEAAGEKKRCFCGSVYLYFPSKLFDGGAAGITRVPLFYLPPCYA